MPFRTLERQSPLKDRGQPLQDPIFGTLQIVNLLKLWSLKSPADFAVIAPTVSIGIDLFLHTLYLRRNAQ
jgi:hypothetical protein